MARRASNGRSGDRLQPGAAKPFDLPLLRWFTVGVLPRTFAALRNRNFRLYWSGNAVSLVGTWMQNITRGWLVLQLTNSPFLVGLETAVAWLPTWFVSLPAGVVADRYSKRNLLIFSQSALAFLALVLAVLTWTRAITIYHILVISGFTGCIVAMDSPVRHAIMPELVGTENLLNGIALNSAAFNAARIIGPSIAGVAIGTIGAAGCFAVNSASFLAIIVALLFVRLHHARVDSDGEPGVPPGSGSGGGSIRPAAESMGRQIADGLRFVAGHKDIRVLMVMIGLMSSFGIIYIPLMPVFARDVFQVGPRGYGLMMAGVGIGALTGLLILATFSRTRHLGRILVTGTVILGTLLIVYSLVRRFELALAVLVCLGLGQSLVSSLTNTLVQTLAPDKIRGRVMSIFTLSFLGTYPLGSLLAGSIAERWGAPAATLVGGSVILVGILVVNLFGPGVRRLWCGAVPSDGVWRSGEGLLKDHKPADPKGSLKGSPHPFSGLKTGGLDAGRQSSQAAFLSL